MTPEDIATMRQRHYSVYCGEDSHDCCAHCADQYPCDAARALDALEETVLAARFNDSAYVRSVNAERARAEAAEAALAEAVWNHAELARRLAAVLHQLDNSTWVNDGHGRTEVVPAAAIRAATGSP